MQQGWGGLVKRGRGGGKTGGKLRQTMLQVRDSGQKLVEEQYCSKLGG